MRRTGLSEGRIGWDVAAELRWRTGKAARELRTRATESERILWEALRTRQLVGRKFRRQQPIGPFVLDFYCSEERLAVEVDGGVRHDVAQAALDAERQQLIESLDIRFVRVAAEQVTTDLSSALNAIRAAFKDRASDEAPLPQWERGGRGPG